MDGENEWWKDGHLPHLNACPDRQSYKFLKICIWRSRYVIQVCPNHCLSIMPESLPGSLDQIVGDVVIEKLLS